MLVVGIWKNAIRRVSPGKGPKKIENVLKIFFDKDYMRCVMRICRNVGSG